jgi:hypothetical protein
MREKVAARDKGKHGIAEDRGDGQAPWDPADTTIDCQIDVIDSPRSPDEFAHQHEKRDDGEIEIAQRLGGGARHHRLNHMHVLGDQIDAEHAGDPQGDRNVHAERDQHRHADDEYGCCRDVKHRRNGLSSLKTSQASSWSGAKTST